MARYAELSITYIGYAAPPAATLSLLLGQVPVTLTFTNTSAEAGFTVGGYRVYQDPTNSFGYGDGQGNVDRIVAALRALLAQVGRADLDALGSFQPFNPAMATTDILTIRLRAKTFGDAYAFQPPIASGWSVFHQITTNLNPQQVEADLLHCRCFGASTGSILLRVTGGVPPYSYAWADGPTTADRPGVSAGSYEVTVTDSAAPDPADPTTALVVPGVVRRRFTVAQNPRLDVLVSKFDNDVTLVVSGGVAPYACTWSDGGTGTTRQDLPPAVYQCTITDANGCAATISVVIEPYRYYFSRNPITLALDAGADYRADPGTKPNLSFVCEVWVEPVYLSDEFVRVGAPLEQPADRAGRTVFQVEELLDAYLDQHVPAVGQNSISRADPLFRRFYLQHAEIYGTPPVRTGSTTLTQHYVTLGGLSRREAATRLFFDSYQPRVRPFFTWQPNDLVVAADQPEFLYFQVPSFELRVFTLQVTLRFRDGTSQTLAVATQAGARRYELYCLPAGFTQLGLPDVARNPLVSWEVWVADGNGVAQSERRRYVLDRRPAAQRRYLLYANSLGGMDTVAFVGEAQVDAEVAGEEAERAPVPFPDPLAGDVLVLERSLRPVVRLASGLRENSREWLAAAQDLLLSRRTFLLSGPYWLPGVLKAKTVPVLKEGEWVQTLEVDFQLARERHYTPRLPVVPAGLAAPPVQRQDLLLP